MPYKQIMQQRLEFLNIDDDTLKDIQLARDILEPVMDELLDHFYRHILDEPDLQALFTDQESIDRARSAQKDYWLNTLFNGKYDNSYYEKAASIGHAHARVSLTPDWYIGGYCQMLNQFITQISATVTAEDKSPGRIIQAINKAIFLDMDLVIQSYLDAKDSSMLDILHRATHFTTDVRAMSDDLHATAKQIQATADKLSADGLTQTSQHSTTEEHIRKLLDQAEQLNHQMTQLDQRLDQLQFGDRLYAPDNIPQPGLIDRLKAMISAKR